MVAVVAGPRPPLRERAAHWSVRFLERVGHLWVENPLNLARFFPGVPQLGAGTEVLFQGVHVGEVVGPCHHE